MAIEPGTALGPYRIGEPVGAGGMGEVYRALDERLGREVAVKVLTAEGKPDAERVRRFEQEARATAALSHPNIVTVYDVGDHQGAPYLVSELLHGESLRRLLDQRGTLEPAEAIGLALQLLRGVGAAHAVKIVHRDLKPDNLFLTSDGTLKVLDFGLAKLKPDAFLDPEAPTQAATQAGALFGTLTYMAPEQVRGEPVDERTDLFAVGAVLYELLTRHAPFHRDTPAETVAAILQEEVPVLVWVGRRPPPSLERVVRRCLEKAPSDRFQTAADLGFALEAVLADLHQPDSAAGLRQPAELAPSIAVLPFADMSPARDQDYLCEGLAEELINALTRIQGLRVAARSSSFQFRGSSADVRAVGTRLGVATVLEGSVRKAGDRLRVTVQLIDVADGYHRWSERYDRKLEDVFAIQDEIAESVVRSLRGVLTERERRVLHRRPETAIETYEYFLRARQLLNQFRRPPIEAARGMFQRAIELDPGYAPAWAGVADCHSWIYQWWGGSEGDLTAAEGASARALELAPELAEARASRGFALSLSGKYEEAQRQFEEAIRLDPTLFDAYYYYARTCFSAGKIERSAELFGKAAEVRREDYQSMIMGAQSLRMLGRSEQAQEVMRQGVDRVERRLELDPTDSRALSLGANALYDLGERERALRWAERAMELYPEEQGVLINAACLMAKAGEKERALEILEKTFGRGWGKRDWIERDPDYDSLRDDPRFQALLEKLH